MQPVRLRALYSSYALLAVAAALAMAGCSSHRRPSAVSDGLVAFVDVTIIPMDTERMVAHQDVLIGGGEILAVVPTGTVSFPSSTQVIQGGGKFLLPGIADMHVHLYNTEAFPSYLAYGVTTVMDLNGSPNTLAWRSQTQEGEQGPTIYVSGPALNGYPPGNPTFVSLDTPDSARRAVAEQRAAGYDLLKVYSTIPQDAYLAIISEARSLGIPVVGHIPWDVGAEEAIKNQIGVVHMEEFLATYFEDDATRLDRIPQLTPLVAASGVTVIPNLFAYSNYLHWVRDFQAALADPEMRYASPAALTEKLPVSNRSIRPNPEGFAQSLRQGHELFQHLTKAFSDAGVPLLLGTDTEGFGFAGQSAQLELQELVSAGLTPYQALFAGSAAAGDFAERYLHSRDRFGRVLPSYRSDLLLLSANPLDRIENAAAIEGVMLRGKWLPMPQIQAMREKAAQENVALKARLAEIDSLIAERKFSEAIRGLGELQELYPARSIVGQLTFRNYRFRTRTEGDAEATLEISSVWAKMYPRSPGALASLAEAQRDLGQNAAALDTLNRARQLREADARIDLRLAELKSLQQPPRFQPAGRYQFSSKAGSRKRVHPVSGEIKIRPTGDGWAGTLALEGKQLELSKVRAGDSRLWLEMRSKDLDIEMPLTISGKKIEGRLIQGFGQNHPLSGQRVEEQ